MAASGFRNYPLEMAGPIMDTHTRLHETISALADGELAASELELAFAALDTDEGRQAWDAYRLIGDVLRAPDLGDARHDAAFVSRLRERLPPQVSVVAPAAARAAANDSVFRWKMAAGLASVAAGALPSAGLVAESPPEQAAKAAKVVASKAACLNVRIGFPLGLFRFVDIIVASIRMFAHTMPSRGNLTKIHTPCKIDSVHPCVQQARYRLI